MDLSHERARPRWSERAILAVLVAAAVLPFVKTLGFGYVMDEIPAIRSNPVIHGWDSLVSVWTHGYGSPEMPFEGLYRPLTMFLYAIVWNLTGGWPVWFHVLALALHAGATVLIWRLLERGAGRAPAALAALWFAMHPVHVEAVANVANTSEILVAIWTCALALYLVRLVEGRSDPLGAASGAPTPVHAVVAGLLCLAAVLSKESGAMSPILALVCLWGWARARATDGAAPGPGGLKRWVPVLAAFAGAACVVVVLRGFVLGGPVTGEPIAVTGIDELSAPRRIAAMLSLAPTILGLLLWTPELNPAYGPSEFARANAALALLVLAIGAAALAAAARLAKRGDRRMLVALLWTVIAFLPASNLLIATGQILAERTLYVPSIGVAMLLALALGAARAVAQAGPARRWIWPAAAAAVLGVSGVSGWRTFGMTEVWRSHESVHTQMIVADPANYRGWWYTAVYLGNNGRMDEAFPFVERAFRMYPADRGLRLDYADALLRRGQARRSAAVAAELMASDVFRARPRAVAVYLDALGRAFGPDSVIAAGGRLMARTATGTAMRTAALYVGAAHEMRGEPAAAARAYGEGLRESPGDSVLAARLAALTQAEPR